MPWRRRFRWGATLCLATIALIPLDADAQTVTYSLGAASDMLDADFHDGKASPGSPTVVASGGRGILNAAVNNAGTKMLFWGIDLALSQQDLYIVNVGSPSSWQRLTSDNRPFSYSPIVWCADDVHAFTGFRHLFNTATHVLVEDHLLNGSTYLVTGTTRMPSDNWVFGFQLVGFGILRAYPVLEDGQGDSNRSIRAITNFTIGPNEGLGFVVPTRDGDSIVFTLSNGTGTPDISDVYRLSGVNDIIAGNTAPPTLFTDPRVAEIRASATGNFVSVPSFSFDGSLVFTSEDYNNVFESNDFFNTLALGDWDINYSNSDGTGFVRLVSADAQGTTIPFPTGNRIHYVTVPSGETAAHIFATTLVAANDIDAETDPLPEGGTTAVIDGNVEPLPFVLTDSAIQTTADVTVADASGTTVVLPEDQVINFPDGSGATSITIVTPIDPVAPVALPDPQIAIPVIRDFGPEGTQFFPPITITITYTDGEIALIEDESAMIPYLYNAGTSMFEPVEAQFLPSVVVDTVNNTLSFQTDHFSVYGMGGASIVTVPLRPWAAALLSAALALLLAWSARPSRRRGRG